MNIHDLNSHYVTMLNDKSPKRTIFCLQEDLRALAYVRIDCWEAHPNPRIKLVLLMTVLEIVLKALGKGKARDCLQNRTKEYFRYVFLSFGLLIFHTRKFKQTPKNNRIFSR